jgi:uncharacterized protein YjeT (DUF2065 family)
MKPKLLVILSIVLVLAGVILWANPVSAKKPADDCKGQPETYSGSFTGLIFGGAGCTSPVGLCMQGTLESDPGVTYDFVFDTLVNDPSRSGDYTKWVFTGHGVMTTDKGVIYTTHQEGVIHMDGIPVAPFVTEGQITGGTHRYKSATGTVNLSGSMFLLTGATTGSLEAYVCR